MSLKDMLESDLKDALRAGQEVRKSTIRMIIASIKLAQVEKGAALDDSEILSIIQKEIKNRKDAILEAQKVAREDLIVENQTEITILEGYLPKQLSEEELRRIIQDSIESVGCVGMADMGKVMKAVMPKIQGRAPGDLVSRLVREMVQR